MDWWELSEMTVHPENIVSGGGDSFEAASSHRPQPNRLPFFFRPVGGATREISGKVTRSRYFCRSPCQYYSNGLSLLTVLAGRTKGQYRLERPWDGRGFASSGLIGVRLSSEPKYRVPCSFLSQHSSEIGESRIHCRITVAQGGIE